MNKMRNNPSLTTKRTGGSLSKGQTLSALSAFLVAITLFSACSSSDGEGGEKKKDSSKTAATPAAPAETFPLTKGRLSTALYTSGELIAYQQVDLYATENSFVKKLYVEVGSEVREGQLLASLEAPELATQL